MENGEWRCLNVIGKIFDFDAFLIPVWNKTLGMEKS
jgi:hypothetical protein